MTSFLQTNIYSNTNRTNMANCKITLEPSQEQKDLVLVSQCKRRKQCH